MIWRTYSEEIVYRAIEQVKDDLKGEPVDKWLADRNNIALCNTAGDVALFEYRQPGTYTGHYFFLSRGKDAIHAAEEFLHEIFTDGYDVQVIIGMTPLDKKGALWLSRHLGFEVYGDEEIDGRMHRIFVMTRGFS